MKKAFMVAIATLAACAPDLSSNTPPSTVVIQFDPAASVPVVPAPNDLALDAKTGLLAVPTPPDASPAQREFNEEYLGTLTGFPFESTASVTASGDLDPSSVTSKAVIVLDVDAPQNSLAAIPSYDGSKRTIVISPPAAGWPRGHRIAVAVIGGSNGVKGAHGEAVVGSSVWALVRVKSPLVTCTDLTSKDCRATTDLIPSKLTDPAARLLDQAQSAVKLEALRRLYAPILDSLEANGKRRDDIAILWTFGIVDAGEMTFDPANNVIPFPNDVLRVVEPTTKAAHLNLPGPDGAPLTQFQCESAAPTPMVSLTCGLNTLDGFSTLAPLISENSDTLGALLQGDLDPASLVASLSVGLVPVVSDAPTAERTVPKFQPCLNCLSSLKADGTAPIAPQQLQWKLNAPLDEKTTYFAYVTVDAKDNKGRNVVPTPTFALLRSSAPLVDTGKSTVSVVSDEQAQRLEPLRVALKPLFDSLAAKGLPRKKLALGFAFTTQSEVGVLDQIHLLPSSKAWGLPTVPAFVVDATTQYRGVASASGIPFDQVGKVYVGEITTAIALSGNAGTLDPTAPVMTRIQFILTLPSTGSPASGYPIAIFGHDFTRSRQDVLALANALATGGVAGIATDILFHGDRTSCTGSKAVTAVSGVTPSDDLACADPVAQRCDENSLIGRCVARADASRSGCAPADTGGVPGDLFCASRTQGACVAADLKCEGGDLKRDATGRPMISGWNLLNPQNLFATRDNFRQHVIDSSQLVRVIGDTSSQGLAGQLGTTFDLTKIGYVGQGMGAILGTLFNAVSPETTNIVLNGAGGALPSLLLNSTQKSVFLNMLASLGIVPGTPAFDQFVGIAQWVLDPADPANMGYRLTHSVAVQAGGSTFNAPNSGRHAFIQFIQGDQTVPNLSNLALASGANRTLDVANAPGLGCAAPLYCYEFTETVDGFDATSATPATRHGFLLKPPDGAKGQILTQTAQGQAVKFLVTGKPQ